MAPAVGGRFHVLINFDSMKKCLLCFAAFVAVAFAYAEREAYAASLAGVCFDRTLRLDYIFSGTDKDALIALDGMSCFDGWAGRRHNLDSVAVRGNGQIRMSDAVTGEVLYRQSFSTLFQEWQTTEEATGACRSFENVFLLPMPSAKAVVRVELYGFRGGMTASAEHIVDPDDILIRKIAPEPAPCKYILRSGSSADCIDVAIVAEGYTGAEQDKFYADALCAMDAILAHEPFSSYRDRFNFVAVALPSADSGVSVPLEGLWKNTALGSHFSTFYSDRYLTTLRVRQMHDKLCGIPYEHIVILANTETYGGGGIFNLYTLTAAGNKSFRPVVVHEFGHSFAGLADEYYYDDQFSEYYFPDCEPWEQNITTLADFSQKWADMIPDGSDSAGGFSAEGVSGISPVVGLYEGAGYQSKRVFRGFPDCRMKTNTAESFCPVCIRAISRIIEFYTERP